MKRKGNAQGKRKKPYAAARESIRLLEADGWTCWNVEQVIPNTFIKRDCFRFADILCMSPSRGIMLVQATGGTGSSNFHARVRKVKSEPLHAIWLASGGRIQVHSHEVVKGVKQRNVRVFEINA